MPHQDRARAALDEALGLRARGITPVPTAPHTWLVAADGVAVSADTTHRRTPRQRAAMRRVTAALADRGACVLPVWSYIARDGTVLEAWRQAAATREPGWRDAADALRRWHGAARDVAAAEALALPRYDLLPAALLDRIDAVAAPPGHAWERARRNREAWTLRQRYVELRAEIDAVTVDGALPTALGDAVLHGDATPSAVQLGAGGAVLTPSPALSVGPLELELLPALAGAGTLEERLRSDPAREVMRALGGDVAAWPALRVADAAARLAATVDLAFRGIDDARDRVASHRAVAAIGREVRAEMPALPAAWTPPRDAVAGGICR